MHETLNNFLFFFKLFECNNVPNHTNDNVAYEYSAANINEAIENDFDISNDELVMNIPNLNKNQTNPKNY